MGKAIQQCSSQEFLTSNQTKPRKTGEASSQVAAPLFQHFQDVVKNELMHDLSEYGIELVRLNFEVSKEFGLLYSEDFLPQKYVVS